MSKRVIEPVVKDNLRLRTLQESDLPMTLQWRNQDDIRRWFFHSEVISLQQHLDWFKNYITKGDDFVFIIEEIQNGYRPIGQVSLYQVDWGAQRAEFGRLMIGEPDAAGKGNAFRASQMAANIAFFTLGLKEIYLEVRVDNKKAIAIYEKMGFQRSEFSGDKQSMRLLVDQPGINI
jgi:RimJ/RimL family protein N-acetyltransferase